ncbi:hypothetical protein HPB52_001393 [Rhipicephalus sanguineus]|uniref:Uncharacterized protein n=1 Tax=Rhipicephalus sanguineus TaxID=34632 RepID=A0A9D4T4N0_RHISA|nr:hypothetical protein HPB52_001393 [Rhipicephalus sanguineus]
MAIVHVVTASETTLALILDVEKHSKIDRLLRVMARTFPFINPSEVKVEPIMTKWQPKRSLKQINIASGMYSRKPSTKKSV